MAKAKTPTIPEVGDTAEAYCVKCKKKQEFEVLEIATTKNGRKMAKGECPECGTKMNRFLPNEE